MGNQTSKHWENIGSLIGAFAVLVLLLIIWGFSPAATRPDAALGAGNQNTLISKMTVSTEVLVNTSSTLILATSTGRQYAVITNNSASTNIYLSLTGSAAVINQGIPLKAGEKYEIKDTNLYFGPVYAIAASAASSSIAAAQ